MHKWLWKTQTQAARAAAIVFVKSQGGHSAKRLAKRLTQACGRMVTGSHGASRSEAGISVVAARAAEAHAWRANFAPLHAKQEVTQQLRVSHPIRPRCGVGGQLAAPQIACHLHVMLMVQLQAAQRGAR